VADTMIMAHKALPIVTADRLVVTSIACQDASGNDFH
jgi:hypothetical protein